MAQVFKKIVTIMVIVMVMMMVMVMITIITTNEANGSDITMKGITKIN